jgi:hypothetical protein
MAAIDGRLWLSMQQIEKLRPRSTHSASVKR